MWCTSATEHDCGKHNPKWMIVCRVDGEKLEHMVKIEIRIHTIFIRHPIRFAYLFESIDVELPARLMFRPTHFVLNRKR